MNPIEKPKFASQEVQDRIEKDVEERKRESLSRLIQENPYNKEPFNYQKFVELYWRQDIQGKDLNGSESQAIIDEYTKMYYGNCPEAKTMEDFAKAKEKLDAEIN